jgi:uncharacterized protein
MTDKANARLSHLDKQPFQNGTKRKNKMTVALGAVAGVGLACALAQAMNAAPARAAPEASTCARGGFVWWNELLAPETEKLTDFYAKVIGWKTKIVDAEDQSQPARTAADQYTIFLDGDQEVAGLMRANHPEAIHSGVGWFTYIQVADVEAAAARAQATGGTVLRPAAETADGSRIAVISDPMGNVFGLVTPAKKGAC